MSSNSQLNWLFTAAVLGAMWTGSPIAAQSYVGVVLYEVDFSVGAVFGGQAVGWTNYGSSDSLDPIDPLLANGPTGETEFLSPPSLRRFNRTKVYDTDGVQQVGGGTMYRFGLYNSMSDHALLWTGTAESVVDLNPPGAGGSIAFGIGGGQQVGSVESHASLWRGTADSAVDLHPSNIPEELSSFALDTDGTQQVGFVRQSPSGLLTRAMVWTGTRASAVDLHPTNLGVLDESIARGVGGGQQVGAVSGPATGNWDHAVLWHGTPETAIDLHPTHFSHFFFSQTHATNGVTQVGEARGENLAHAMLWTGTPDSALDLHELLLGDFRRSEASAIDALGRIYGRAMTNDGQQFAVMWTPVPEPSAAILSMAGILGISGNRTIRRKLALSES